MSGYVYISLAALYCYLFFMAVFLPAKKNRLIFNFMAVLLTMILWTGGSLLMRLQVLPSYRFWYHVSLAGIWLLPYSYFCFIREFCRIPAKGSHRLWGILLLAGTVINFATEWFLAAPELVESNGRMYFVYHMGPQVCIMYGLCVGAVVHMFRLVRKTRKRDPERAGKLNALLLGIVILILGNVGISVINNFPLDILAGIFNAVIMFYSLYSLRLFTLTGIGSRGSCYVLAIGISVMAFYNLAQTMNEVIQEKIPSMGSVSVMVVVVVTTVATWLIYLVMKMLFDRIFIGEEASRTEKLSEYTMAVSSSLRMNEIFQAMVSVLERVLNVKKIYICVEDEDGRYPMVYSSSPLDDRSFSMTGDHPLVRIMEREGECLLLRDFKRTVEYKSLWEDEKEQIDAMKVECFLPLKDNGELVGVVFLGPREGKRGRRERFDNDDISFLRSIQSVSSIAVKNSRMYERTYREACTDRLTGLLNREHFLKTMDEFYEKYKNSSLALIIFSVDDFKLYNQLYGEAEGDEALRHIAQIIRGTVGGSGRSCRYSGKEFAVLLPGYDIFSARGLAENISAQINDINRQRGEDDTYFKALTVSCGICAIPYAATTARELLSNADLAVYHVKRTGKNGIMVYSDQFISEKTGGAARDQHRSKYEEYAPTIYALTAAIDAKDHYTFQHSKSVAHYAEALAREAGGSEEFQEIVKEAGLLHDIGKIGIPENILNKKGKLTDEEYEVMKKHVASSVEIIRHLPLMDYVIPAVIGHHERYDGRGYPRRVAGKDIPLAARILCIVDSFDAMVSKRCYKQSMPVDEAVKELERGAGTQFDPELVPIFCEMIRSGRLKPILEYHVDGAEENAL